MKTPLTSADYQAPAGGESMYGTGELAVSMLDSHAASVRGSVFDYVSIARPDHWLKNVFMLIGVVLAYFYMPTLFGGFHVGQLLMAFLATCLVASSNYVLNEILDAPTDA